MPQFLVAPKDVHDEGREAVLRGEEARHLLSVMRARPGDRILLFDGAGSRWSARLKTSTPDEARVGDLSPLPSNESPVEVTLLQSMPKGDRWEWTLEKATELGVARFVPVLSRYSVARVSEDRQLSRVRRWRGIAAAAAKQCERGTVPAVDPPAALAAFLSGLPEPRHGEARIVLEARLPARRGLPFGPVDSVLLAVGPEGGWSPDETEAFQEAGFVPVGLGPRVLRSETAALAGLVAVHLRWGDLAGGKTPCSFLPTKEMCNEVPQV